MKRTRQMEKMAQDLGISNVIARVEHYADKVGVDARLQPWTPFPGVMSGIELTDFFARQPGTGAGSKVMSKLLALADDIRLPVYLKPSSPRAREFYSRFGFEADSRHPGFMLRAVELTEEDFVDC